MSSYSHLHLLYIDGNPLQDLVLGMGRCGVVVRRGDVAFKLPLRYSTTGLSEDDIEYFNRCADISRESLDREKEVYRRLGQNNGIVSCLDVPGVGLQLALMKSGNLYDYLAQLRPIKLIQVTWVPGIGAHPHPHSRSLCHCR